MKPSVVCYGELGIDNLVRLPHLPSPELAAFPTSESYQVGGAAANTAVWLSHWGVAVRLAGNFLGEDEYGDLLISHLAGLGSLDSSYIRRRPGVRTPFCRVMVTPDGERTFLVYWYPQAPKVALSEEMLSGAKFLALDLYGGEERLDAARLARACGVRTVVGDVVGPDHPALPVTDICTNSAAYIRQVFPGADVRQHAASLQRISGGLVVTTDGPRPVHVVGPQGLEFEMHPPEVVPLDATGAGDAFRAGLIYGMLEGWPIERCVRFGAAAGALGVQQEGAASDPASVEEVEALSGTI